MEGVGRQVNTDELGEGTADENSSSLSKKTGSWSKDGNEYLPFMVGQRMGSNKK